MLFLSSLIRIVFILLVVRFVLRAIASFLRPKSRTPGAGAPEPRSLQGDMVRDRVCNTFILRDRAVWAMVAGVEESFCSVVCRDKALGALPKAG
jgi:hypothetical protein